MAMQEIIRDLKTLPDVRGGFFFHRKNGVLCQDLPSNYEDSLLNDTGRQLSKMYAARRLNFPEVGEINLYFTGAAIFSRAIDEQVMLVLLCEHQVNSATLSASVRLAVEEHSDGLTGAGLGTGVADRGKGAAPQLSPEQALAGPLKQPLEEIQHILVDLMGPMAELVYEENLEKWMASGRIGSELLPELIDLLAADMPDVKKATAFKDRCRSLM